LLEGSLSNWQLAIKPGKPLAFGSIRREGGGSAVLLALPGNPVSSFVTWLLAVRPVLRVMQGLSHELPAATLMRADFDWPKPDKRREFLRVQRNPQGGLSLFPNQSSGVLSSVVWADGLVDCAPGQALVRGQAVPFLSLAELVAS